MEETRNEEMVTFEEIENDGMDMYDYPEVSSGGILKKVAVGVVGSAVTAVGAAVIVKNKHKIEQWRDLRRIKKLEKKGYIVYESVEDDYEDDYENDSNEVVSNETEE